MPFDPPINKAASSLALVERLHRESQPKLRPIPRIGVPRLGPERTAFFEKLKAGDPETVAIFKASQSAAPSLAGPPVSEGNRVSGGIFGTSERVDPVTLEGSDPSVGRSLFDIGAQLLGVPDPAGVRKRERQGQRASQEQSQIRQQEIRANIRKEQGELNVGGASAIMRGMGSVLIEQELVTVDPKTQKLTGNKVFEKIIAQVQNVPDGPVAQTLVKLIIKHMPQIFPKGKDGKPDIKNPDAAQQAIRIFTKVLNQTANSGSDAVRSQLGNAFTASGLDINNFDQLYKRGEQAARIARESAERERKAIRGEQGQQGLELAGSLSQPQLKSIESLTGSEFPRKAAPTTADATTLTVEPKPDTLSFGAEPSITETNIGGGVGTPTPGLETQALTTPDLAVTPTAAPQIDRLNPVKLAADAIPDNIAKGQLTPAQGRLIANTNASLIKSNINENAKVKVKTPQEANNTLRTIAGSLGVEFKELKFTGKETPGRVQLIFDAALSGYAQQIIEKGALARVIAKPPTAAMLKFEQEKRDTRANHAIVEALVAIDMRPGNPGFDKEFQKAEDDYNANRKGEGDQGENFPSSSKVAELMNDPDVKGGLSQAIIDGLRERGIRPEEATGEQIGEVREALFQQEIQKIAQTAQSEADIKAIKKIAPLLTAIERLQGLAQGLTSNRNFIIRGAIGVFQSLNAFFEVGGPDARIYKAQADAYGRLIAKATLEDRLSNQEGDAFVAMLPDPLGPWPNTLLSTNILFADMKQLLTDTLGPSAARHLRISRGGDKDQQGRFERFKKEQQRKLKGG